MFAKLAFAFSHLRLRPFGTDTAEGRASERYRLASWNAIANILSTGIGMLAFIITVPLTLSYLGAERFGVWMTMASLAGMLSFLDLGVANGLVNFVARAKAGGDSQRLAEVVSRGIFLLVLVGLCIGIVILCVNALFPLASMLKVDSPAAREEAANALLVFMAIFICSIPINGLSRVLAGMQESWRIHLAKISASVVSVFLILVLAQKKAPVPILLLATFGIQTAAPLFLLPRFFRAGWFKLSSLARGPSLKKDFSAMTAVGGLFLMLQIGTMIGWGADALLVASVLGVSEVAKLAVAQRLFQFVTLPFSIINAPLWAAYADAKQRNDRLFIHRTLKRSLALTFFLSAILSASVYIASDWLLSHWLRQTLTVSGGLLAGFAVWSVIEATGNAFAMYLNGNSVIKTQVILVAVFCCVALPLKIFLMAESGVQGVVYGAMVAYVAVVAPMLVLIYRREFKGV